MHQRKAPDGAAEESAPAADADATMPSMDMPRGSGLCGPGPTTREIEDYETPLAPSSALCGPQVVCVPTGCVKQVEEVVGIDLDKLHLARNILHICCGLTMIQIRHHKGVRFFERLMTLLLSFVILVEAMRLHYPWFNHLCTSWLGSFMRKSEARRFTSVFYYLAGVLLVSKITQGNFLVFDAATANLAVGDPVASLAGLVSGNMWPLGNGKCWAGFVCAWFCNCSALVYVYAAERQARREMAFLGYHSVYQRVSLACMAGMVGAAAEVAVPSPPPKLESKKFPLGLDDNFIIPLATCMLVQSTVDYLAEGHSPFDK